MMTQMVGDVWRWWAIGFGIADQRGSPSLSAQSAESASICGSELLEWQE
jgi:hypothetical protein